MISHLEAALASGEVPSDPVGFARALELLDRLAAKVHIAAARFDASGAWAEDGYLDAAGFISDKARCSRGGARRMLGVGKKLAQLPELSRAWQNGEVSGPQVEVVLSKVGRHVELFASQETSLVPVIAGLSLRQSAAAMSDWAARAEAIEPEVPASPEEASELYICETMEGRREVSGHFCARDGADVQRAIEAAMAWDDGEGTPMPTSAARRADALVGICRFYLANRLGLAASRHGTHIGVLVRYEDFVAGGPGHTREGMPLSEAQVAAAACDGVVRRIVYSGASAVLDFGRATRVISSSLWAALVARDGHCRHPGCDRPPSWCHGHHVVHYSQGGHTKLDNLVLACTRHHHIWHDKRWRLKLLADGLLELVSPTGQRYHSRPEPLEPARFEPLLL